jgi:AraC family transcriptional regulator
MNTSTSAVTAAATLASSAKRGWDGVGAALLRIPAGRHVVPAQAHHRLGMHIGVPVKANCWCDGRRRISLQSHGDAGVVPVGLDGVWTDDGDCTLLSVWFSDGFIQHAADDLGIAASRARIQPRFQWRDKRVEHLGLALLGELEADDPSNALYAESLCTALVVRMISSVPALGRQRQTFAPGVARRVVDFVDAHLDERLLLSDLAAVAGISVPHFKVLFRETIGMPVHQYVIGQRVDRAKQLLLPGKLSVSEAALAAGFSHPSHMAHWMKRILGVTPRELLKAGDK